MWSKNNLKGSKNTCSLRAEVSRAVVSHAPPLLARMCHCG